MGLAVVELYKFNECRTNAASPLSSSAGIVSNCSRKDSGALETTKGWPQRLRKSMSL